VGANRQAWEEKPNPLMNWETVNSPEWWVPQGLCPACGSTGPRQRGKSPGQCEPWFQCKKAIDFYDAIEWAGRRNPGCKRARSGFNGILVFSAINQWVRRPTCRSRRP